MNSIATGISQAQGFDSNQNTRRSGLFARLWRGLTLWAELRRQRRHLGELEDHLLADIGLSRSQARRESRRWFLV